MTAALAPPKAPHTNRSGNWENRRKSSPLQYRASKSVYTSMKYLHALLLLVVMTASGVATAGPDSTYRAPRAHDGHPDLQGVWNFASGVPLQRRAAFGDQTVMTLLEFAKQRAALLAAL